MEIKLEKVVNYRKPYLGKDGKERPSTALYLVFPTPNGEKRVCIKATFAKDRPSDAWYLDYFATPVIIRKEDAEPSAIDEKSEGKK